MEWQLWWRSDDFNHKVWSYMHQCWVSDWWWVKKVMTSAWCWHHHVENAQTDIGWYMNGHSFLMSVTCVRTCYLWEFNRYWSDVFSPLSSTSHLSAKQRTAAWHSLQVVVLANKMNVITLSNRRMGLIWVYLLLLHYIFDMFVNVTVMSTITIIRSSLFTLHVQVDLQIPNQTQ
jgi:hypothetical protein